MERLTGNNNEGMGFGLGKLVERVMGWGLAPSGKDADGGEEGAKVSVEQQGNKQEMKREAIGTETVTMKQNGGESGGGGAMSPGPKGENAADMGKQREEENDEMDMAWFLSVATRTLLS